ncbi:aliphatic sulfonate ABC transporter substrate-binding protein [Acinetobacter qingfengensis]|uniref:Putative aliphatic sulfonates-binding protein n=1 Tax=Acinetobacter qingfengensis TaxID=1262585 RepID=A0A1E7RDI7_9GAMM|nr:aliphatic sulfonate ABC transporter substrate-binding protein [Acinetobacter qingfengensis]KAA8733724.1 aliphatic sulfonate ABC transporter substrate-binding protein [Acinetobacter qingfengensis]OEY97460.1 sulfonate ABC transporter substrate-binding protein [Acinetobacter qingfengensis]
MRLIPKNITFLGITIFAVLLSACSPKEKKEASAASSASPQDKLSNIAIGYQKSSLNQVVAKDQKIFEKEFPNVKIEWKEFPAGPQLLEALAVGSVDFGAVGNTPAIFAQSAGKDVLYVSYQDVKPSWQSLVVPADSKINTIADLKGKRIAIQKGSSSHDFVSRILKKGHLTWQDIQPVWLAPADARAALNKKAVDAWANWEPFVTPVELDGTARSVLDATGLGETYNFLIANPKFVHAHSQETQKVIATFNIAAQWIVDHPHEANLLYQKATGLEEAQAQRVLDKRYQPSIDKPMTDKVIAVQQEVADRFYAEKLIPKPIDVRQVVWVNQ